jgi:hypothetical protein
MAFGNFMVRHDLCGLGVPSCHRAGGLRNPQNGLLTGLARKHRQAKLLRPYFDVFCETRSISSREGDF